MNNKKREIFVFVGQNASTGTPHPTTGRMSFYGRIYRIDGTLRQAREFADHKYYNGRDNLCIAGGRRKMREFCLGIPGYVFDQCLSECETVFADDEKSVTNWEIS